MNEKGFEATVSLEETPNFIDTAEKPLKPEKRRIKKVDINVLKARAQKIEDKENKRNILIFFIFLVLLATAGIYLSI